MKKLLILICLLLSVIINSNAQENKENMKLVSPKTSGGMELLDAIKARRSERQISSKMLSTPT